MDSQAKPAGDKKEKDDQIKLLKFRLNNFLIGYFNHLVWAGAIIIFAFGSLFLVYPKYRQTAEQSAAIKNSLRSEYEDKLKYLDLIRGLKEDYQSVSREERRKIEKMVPAEDNAGELIAELEGIAVKNGVILNSVKVDKISSAGRSSLAAATGEKKEPPAGIFASLPAGLASVKLTVILSAVNYRTLKQVVNSLENSLRLYDLSKIDFNPGDSEAVLEVYTYYFSS